MLFISTKWRRNAMNIDMVEILLSLQFMYSRLCYLVLQYEVLEAVLLDGKFLYCQNDDGSVDRTAVTNGCGLLQLLPELPSMISRLYNEQRCGRVSACRVLPQLVELLHCLMFMHPGFPEMYRPVVAAINVRFSFIMYLH